MRHIAIIEKRLDDLESRLHCERIPTMDSGGNKQWLSVSGKDILDIYVSLLEIQAAETSTEPTRADIPPEMLDILGLWARAELGATNDQILIYVRDEAKRILATEAAFEEVVA